VQSNSASSIRRWFMDHIDDGEFVHLSRDVPYHVVVPSGDADPLIYVTKPVIVGRLFSECVSTSDFGMVGRYGLPSDVDAAWIRGLVGSRDMFFLGDMDPVDLLVFGWLRASLTPKDVRYMGVSDALLGALSIKSPEFLVLPCTASERECIPFLEAVLPDLQQWIGSQCLNILKQGQKLEIDGVANIDIQNLGAALERVRQDTKGNGDEARP